MQSNTIDFFSWMESSTDEEKITFFKKGILKLLNTDEYEINHILSEFRTTSEYIVVFFYLKDSNIPPNTKPSINPHKLQDEKEKIEIRKKRVLDDLKYLQRYASLSLNHECKNMLISAIETSGIDMRVYSHRLPEARLKDMKNNLYEALIEDCKTGKARAKQIIKILDYI